MAVPIGEGALLKTKGMKELTLAWDIADYNTEGLKFEIKSPEFHFEDDMKLYMTLYPRVGTGSGIFLNEVGGAEINGIKMVKLAIVDSAGRCLTSKAIDEPVMTGGRVGIKNFARAGNFHRDDDVLRIRCEMVVDQKEKVKEEQLQGSNLSHDLGEMLESKKFCDFKIKCDDKVYNCSRIVLGARSKVFRAMFMSGMKEARIGEIVIEGVRAEVMEQAVKFMYTDEVTDEVLAEMADELLAVGHRYEISSLKMISEKFLAKNVSDENAMDMLELAKFYSLEYLKMKIIDFLKNVDPASLQL